MHAAVTASRDIRAEVGALRERFPEVQFGFTPADLD
jgi:hypothetical protein